MEEINRKIALDKDERIGPKIIWTGYLAIRSEVKDDNSSRLLSEKIHDEMILSEKPSPWKNLKESKAKTRLIY